MATILRQDALCKKIAQEEEKELREFEETLRNDTEYQKWKAESQTQDKINEANKIKNNFKNIQNSKISAIQAKKAIVCTKIKIIYI